jgi:hypothetical protein
MGFFVLEPSFSYAILSLENLFFSTGERVPLSTKPTHIGLMATLFLTLLLHFAGLIEPTTNRNSAPTTTAQSIASQADGGAGNWTER